MESEPDAWPSLSDHDADAAARALLAAAGIAARPDLAGAMMWQELRVACFHSRAWGAIRQGISSPDIARVSKVEHAARTLAEALVGLSSASEPALIAFMRTAQRPEHQAAGPLVKGWSAGPAALANLARDARVQLEAEAQQPPTLAQGKHATGAAFLLCEALPGIYRRHVGGVPTWTPASDLAKPSAFLRFARVVMQRDGLPPMTDDAMMVAKRRWTAAEPTWTRDGD